MSSNTVKINCPFCSSSNQSLFDSENEWKIVSCNDCNFIFTNPRPTAESLPSYYGEEYFKDKRHRKKFYNDDGSLKKVSDAYINRIEDNEAFRKERGAILEVGSARGGFLRVMKNRGWIVQGVEISKDASDIANDDGINTFNGELQNYNSNRKFDSICMYQTLEHVPNPLEIVQKSHKLLNEGGQIVIEVPNIKCTELKFNKTRKHLSYDLPRHLNHFAPDFLAKKLEENGFEVVSIKLFPGRLAQLIINLREKLRKPEKQINNIKTIESEATIPLMSSKRGRFSAIIDKINSALPGWRFTIIAIKKNA